MREIGAGFGSRQPGTPCSRIFSRCLHGLLHLRSMRSGWISELQKVYTGIYWSCELKLEVVVVCQGACLLDDCSSSTAGAVAEA